MIFGESFKTSCAHNNHVNVLLMCQEPCHALYLASSLLILTITQEEVGVFNFSQSTRLLSGKAGIRRLDCGSDRLEQYSDADD